MQERVAGFSCTMIFGTVLLCGLLPWPFASAFVSRTPRMASTVGVAALSKYLENDMVSVRLENNKDSGDNNNNNSSSSNTPARLYVVTPESSISPLCTHEDDNPTDLHLDPRSDQNIDIDDDAVIRCYGEGYFSQRVVPSLGGGPGYGAEANPVWTVDEDLLEELERDGVEIPTLDMGIAHREKARGGAL